ncbi:hypothetical protein SABIM44S_01247 [Streptomyces abikoensis]
MGGRVLGTDAARGLDAVAAGHPQVHQHHVRGVLGDEPHRLLAVGRRADHLDARQQPQQHHDSLAHHGLVVGHDDPRDLAHAAGAHTATVTRHAGTRRRTTNPSSPDPAGPASSVPPSSSARSLIPSRPYPAPAAPSSPGAPRAPRSRTHSSTHPSR